MYLPLSTVGTRTVARRLTEEILSLPIIKAVDRRTLGNSSLRAGTDETRANYSPGIITSFYCRN
jgi:hypothetical protein